MTQVPILTSFNNTAGFGVSLVYHTAWMLAQQDLSVLVVDLEPQSNLTAAFLAEEELETLMEGDGEGTIFSAVRPLLEGTGDAYVPEPRKIDEGLHLLAGDLRLHRYEDALSDAWARCLLGEPRALRVLSAFHHVMQACAEKAGAGLILVDAGPSFGALTRAALIASDYVVVPIVPDLFSIHGLRNLGPALASWRTEWQLRLDHSGAASIPLPSGGMQPLGYVVQQHAVRLDRPMKSFERWMRRIPGEYATHILGQAPTDRPITGDPECLAMLKNYRSLMPLAQEARKPMFFLKPADGAVGGHAAAVGDVYLDYKRLAARIAERVGLAIPA